MKKISGIVFLSIMFLLCACGKDINYKYQLADVSAENQDALELYDNGKFKDSLALYLETMQEEPKDLTARIGVVKCQIALENYDMALMNLYFAVDMMPQEEEIYDLFIEISKLTDNISIAQQAVELASLYGVESFLKKLPEKPVFEYEEGKYNQQLKVSIDSNYSDATDIYFSVNKVAGYQFYNMEYTQPLTITNGETLVSAYCVRDGVPSETVEVTYICEYEPSAVQFKDPVIEQLVRTILDIPEGEITDIDCEQITSLDIYEFRRSGMDNEEYQRMKIQTLDDLKYFPYLTTLYLYAQVETVDYLPIKLCPLLSNLYVNDSNLSDISFISELPNLTYLYIPNNQITDFSSVLRCKKMSYLYINGNPSSDISDLVELQRIYSLGLDVGQLKEIGILSQLHNLRDLQIYCQGSDDISKLGELNQLESLAIYYYYWNYDYDERVFIKDISYLENLTNLTYLYISGLEDLSQIDPLKKLINLQNLYLYNRNNVDKVTDAAAIQELQQALPQCNISY